MFLMKHPVTAFAAVLMIVFILLQIIAGHFAIPSAAQEPQQDPNGPPKKDWKKKPLKEERKI